MDTAVEQRALGSRLLDRVADDHQAPGQDLDVIGVAAGRLAAAFDVGIEALGVREIAAAGEDHLGRLAGKLAAGVRRASLDDDGPALDRPGDVERPAHREELALVVESVHAGRIEIDAAFDVADKGVFGEAVPEAGDDIVELAGAAVALAVIHMLGHAEIERGVGVRRGDEVPPGPAVADVVERGKTPGDHVGRLEGRRSRGDEPDVLGHHRQSRQQGQRIERGHRRAALQRRHRHVEHGQVVGHEPGVEASLLELLHKADQVLQVEVRIRVGAGIAPPAGMDPDRAHKGPQPQLTPCRHHRRSLAADLAMLPMQARQA
jgi:hypothetical protein